MQIFPAVRVASWLPAGPAQNFSRPRKEPPPSHTSDRRKKCKISRGKFVAYYRVSTDTQRKSGVGLDAQRKAVRDYLDGGKWELVGEFTEVETGKRSDRPELAKAIAVCKKHRARLIIAKLDRLSRDLARKQISRRTVEALAAAKARGVKLGNYARISKAKQEAPNAP